MSSTRDRIKSDYLSRSRVDALVGLLVRARERGFDIRPCSAILSSELPSKTLLLRIDVDSHTRTATALATEFARNQIRSTFFLRRSTLDRRLSEQLVASGSEVGYHYEEISDALRKAPYLASAPTLISMAQDRHLENLNHVRSKLGVPVTIAAAHGDWMNRRAGISNAVLYADPGFEHRAGMQIETYQERYLARVTHHLSDGGSPVGLKSDVLDGIEGPGLVQLLCHPRHWAQEPLASASQDALRLLQGVVVGVRSKTSQRK